jgi:RNA polymerase sigma factor (sigma-70 family)
LEEPTHALPGPADAGDVAAGGRDATRNAGIPEPAADPRSASDADSVAAFADRIHRALAYVPSVARRYFGCGLPFEDLLAAGNLGLVEAAMRFDAGRNVKFVTYADWWIRKAILGAIEEQAGPVRLPRYRQEQLRNLHDARARLRMREGREPDFAELARATGLPVADVEKLLGFSRQAVSLEQPGGADDERPLHETLASAPGRGPQDILLDEDSSGRLRTFVASLGERERAVLTLRYGLAGAPPLTLREVGRRLEVSRERVRQIEHRALLNLRRMLQSGNREISS